MHSPTDAAPAPPPDAHSDAGAHACARPAAVNGLVAASYDPSCRTYADCMAINPATIPRHAGDAESTWRTIRAKRAPGAQSFCCT
jgi:hypothetical protein